MAKTRYTLTWAASEARIREIVGIASGSDSDLEELFETALFAGDRYMNNFFVGVDPLPSSILRGVGEYMKAYIAGSAIGNGIGTIKTGDLLVTYASAAGSGYAVQKVAMKAARPFWKAYRLRMDC